MVSTYKFFLLPGRIWRLTVDAWFEFHFVFGVLDKVGQDDTLKWVSFYVYMNQVGRDLGLDTRRS